ncbi:MAG: hypothetical protein ACE5J2_02280 [Nitrososphaerales archaeon]
MNPKLGLLILTLAATILLVALIQIPVPAYGHGLANDIAPAATMGDIKVTVFVKMTPAFLKASIPEDATIQIIFQNVETGQPIPHVTYFVRIDKDGKVLMADRFHDHEGDLEIKIRPKEAQETTVFGEKEPILGGWFSRGGPVLAEGPIFLDGGMHHFYVEILSIVNDNTILDQPVKFDAYVTVGERTTYTVTDGGGQQYTLGISTYFDKIKEFEYDDKNKVIEFSMPFTWDMGFLGQVPLVHEEVVIPKAFSELMSGGYKATVNGIEVPRTAIMIDDADPEKRLVHYMLTNEKLMRIAEKVHEQSDGSPAEVAIFTLRPSEPVFPLQTFTPNEIYKVELSWSPATIEPGKPTKFIFNFRDPKTDSTIRQVPYTFMLIKDGEEIYKSSKTAVIGAEVEEFTFNEQQAGSVSLRIEKINNTDEFVQFELFVIPEFPISMLAILAAGVFVIAILITKRASGQVLRVACSK